MECGSCCGGRGGEGYGGTVVLVWRKSAIVYILTQIHCRIEVTDRIAFSVGCVNGVIFAYSTVMKSVMQKDR